MATIRAWHRIPDNRELSAQYLLLYELSLPYGLDLNDRHQHRQVRDTCYRYSFEQYLNHGNQGRSSATLPHGSRPTGPPTCIQRADQRRGHVHLHQRT